MPEINLLKSLPNPKRNVNAREGSKSDESIRIAREFGEQYFDGPRDFGYGGYKYDGRWKPVAKDIINHFSLSPGDKVLDIGCGKGFLVKDLLELGIDAYGLDISSYALLKCEDEVIGRLHHGNASSLPFPDNSFDAVLSINTIHNLERQSCLLALREIQRISGGRAFIQVDSFHTPEQKTIFENWVLTAKFYGYPEEWISLFKESGYAGDWYWTIIE